MMKILNLIFKNRNKCSHKKALLTSDEGYCPDCGEYLIKNYYITRCSCCEIKRETKLYWDEIVPVSKFCPNCGSREYYIEKLENINFINAQYAVYIKESANELKTLHPEVQIWADIEKENVKQIETKS